MLSFVSDFFPSLVCLGRHACWCTCSVFPFIAVEYFTMRRNCDVLLMDIWAAYYDWLCCEHPCLCLGARRHTFLWSTSEWLESHGQKQSPRWVLLGRWFIERALSGAACSEARRRGQGGEGTRPASTFGWSPGSLIPRGSGGEWQCRVTPRGLQ